MTLIYYIKDNSVRLDVFGLARGNKKKEKEKKRKMGKSDDTSTGRSPLLWKTRVADGDSDGSDDDDDTIVLSHSKKVPCPHRPSNPGPIGKTWRTFALLYLYVRRAFVPLYTLDPPGDRDWLSARVSRVYIKHNIRTTAILGKRQFDKTRLTNGYRLLVKSGYVSEPERHKKRVWVYVCQIVTVLLNALSLPRRRNRCRCRYTVGQLHQ